MKERANATGDKHSTLSHEVRPSRQLTGSGAVDHQVQLENCLGMLINAFEKYKSSVDQQCSIFN